MIQQLNETEIMTTTLQILEGGSQIFNQSATDTKYKTLKIEVKSKIYSVTIADGKYNYYFIKQENHNRFGGKYFATLDMAIDYYKSIAMKTALMQIK